MNMRHHLLTFKIYRRGFTLVELLIAISIMGILAGMVLYTLAGAQREAKVTKTKATIEKINSILMERFEEYRYRSVKLQIPISLTRKNPPSGVVPLSPRTAAGIRAIVLKDLMRMELPDRMSDLEFTPTNVSFRITHPQTSALVVVTLNDAAWGFTGRYSPREYNILRNYFNLTSIPEPWNLGVVSVPATSLSNGRWESAECLYAILAHSAVAGGPALEGFHPSEIGDKDGDGYPEFWDAWENPIGWLRWPAGYPSDLNVSYKGTLPANPNTSLPPSPDAFDPYRTHSNWDAPSASPPGPVQKPWTLVPLVISAGPDGVFGLEPDTPPTPPTESLIHPSVTAYAVSQDPYYPTPDGPTVGSVVNATATQDNISNHDLLLE